ncbi:MAG: GNAT family N-acetyltransferase [Erythrobacter sp.]
MAYAIRPFQESDAEALSALTLATIRSIGARRYSPTQIDAWAARHPGPQRFLDRHAQGHLIFVAAAADDTAVAYALLERDGHLDMLYCHPDHTRKGLAEELLAHCEQQARVEGIERLYTEASELALPSFERAGFKVTQRRDFTIEHAGERVPIHNFAMEKSLA